MQIDKADVEWLISFLVTLWLARKGKGSSNRKRRRKQRR
jgi:hypothetical protein